MGKENETCKVAINISKLPFVGFYSFLSLWLHRFYCLIDVNCYNTAKKMFQQSRNYEADSIFVYFESAIKVE